MRFRPHVGDEQAEQQCLFRSHVGEGKAEQEHGFVFMLVMKMPSKKAFRLHVGDEDRGQTFEQQRLSGRIAARCGVFHPKPGVSGYLWLRRGFLWLAVGFCVSGATKDHRVNGYVWLRRGFLWGAVGFLVLRAVGGPPCQWSFVVAPWFFVARHRVFGCGGRQRTPVSVVICGCAVVFLWPAAGFLVLRAARGPRQWLFGVCAVVFCALHLVFWF